MLIICFMTEINPRAIISRVYKLEHVARNGLIAALSLIVALNNV